MKPLDAHDANPITALSARTAAPSSAQDEFMVMPGGDHTIYCGQGSKDVSVRIRIDKASAAALEEQRKLLSAASAHRPFFDFDHSDGKASFWPTQFIWRDAPAGVYARGEWSEAGRRAIEGKDYRAFSPKFHVDDIKATPAKVICYARASLNMGGFVNDPAFKNNLPLWAKAGATGENQNQNTMTKEQKAALQAQLAQLETEIQALQGQQQTAENLEAMAAKQTQIDGLKAQQAQIALEEENANLREAITSQRKREANAAVKAAVARGAIPSKDNASQEMWENMATEDPTKLALIAALRGSTALQPRQALTGISIARESNSSVLNGMASVNTRNSNERTYEGKRNAAREFAALYAREILPRLKEGDDIPLAAVNSVGTLGTLVSSMVSTRTLELLTLSFPMLKAIATDFSDQIVNYGDTLTTHIVTIPAVSTYNTTTGWGKVDYTATPVTITYDQKRGVDIAIGDQNINSTVRRLFDEVAPAQAYALAKDVVDFVYALITGAFTAAAQSVPLINFDRSSVIDIGGALDDTANPDMGRTLILNRAYYSKLKKDPTLITLSAYQQSQMNMITQGVINNVEDFQVIKAVNLPATVISGKTLAGFGFTRSALLLATRLSADYMNVLPGAANGNLTVITTPAGLSANQVQYVDNVLATANQRLEIIYGGNRGQVAAGCVVTT